MLSPPDRNLRPLFGAARLTTMFRDIGFVLESGESVGTVGASGSGKASLAQTLLRPY